MFRRVRLVLLILVSLSGTSRAADPEVDAAAVLAAGRPGQALALARQAIAAAPGAPAPHLAAARAAIALGDGVTAQAEGEKARDAGLGAGAVAPVLAEAALLQGDPDTALSVLSGPVAPAEAGEAARVQGRALVQAGDLGGAAQAFDRALVLEPGDPRLWTDIGRFRLATGERLGAVAAADRAVALGPRLRGPLLLKAELSRDQYGLVAALPWFDRALASDPDNVPARLDRAATLGDSGRASDALADIREAQRRDPRNPQAFYLEAAIAARAGRFALARRILDRTGGSIDDQPGPQLLEGVVALGTGAIEQAIERLGRLLATQPGNDKARLLLARAEWIAGDPHAVVRTLAPLAARPDAGSYALVLMARAEERVGDRLRAGQLLDRAALAGGARAGSLAPPVDPDALADLAGAAAQHPDEAGPATDYAAALIAAGRAQDALPIARRVAARNPGAPAAQLLAGDTLAALGHFADAAQAYRLAANIGFNEGTAMRLIDALRRAGDAQGAFAVLDLFLRQHPLDVPARRMAAAFLVASGRVGPAAEVLGGLVRQMGPGDAVLLNDLAWAQWNGGERRQALAAAAAAHRLLPASPATAETFGWMLALSGGREAGLPLLAQAAATLPDEPRLKARLAAARTMAPQS